MTLVEREMTLVEREFFRCEQKLRDFAAY
eukprot:g8574.t1